MTLRVNASDKILRINDYALVGLVQNFEYSPALNAEDVFELGNPNRVDTSFEYEATGSFELLDSGALPGILARAIIQRDSSNVPTGYMYASGGANGKNAYTISEADLEEVMFDLIEHERTDFGNFNRSFVMPRCFLTGISGRADTNGMASVTLNFANDFAFGAPTPYHDQKSVRCVRSSGTTITTTPLTLWTGYAIAYVYVNERRFRTTNTDPTYVTFTTPASGLITFTTTEGYVVPLDAQIRVIMYKTSGSTQFLSVNSGEQGTTATHIKGYMVSMYIAPVSASAPTSPEQWLRVQSVDYNIDLKVQVLKQIAQNLMGSAVYARVATYPFDIAVNASVTETDWVDWKAILNKTFPGNDFYQDSYDLVPASLKTSFNIVMVQYTRAGTKLCEYRFTDMRVDSQGMRVAVQGVGEVTWSFKGTKFTIVGYNA